MFEGPALVAEFCRRLREEGGTVRPGVSEARLQVLEDLIQAPLPTDMRSFYLGVDGMENEFPFDSFVRVLAIDEVVPLGCEFPGDQPPDALLVGDASIAAYFYAIDINGRAGPAGAVYLACPQPLRVARSFGTFVNDVLADSPRLHDGEESVQPALAADGAAPPLNRRVVSRHHR